MFKIISSRKYRSMKEDIHVLKNVVKAKDRIQEGLNKDIESLREQLNELIAENQKLKAQRNEKFERGGKFDDFEIKPEVGKCSTCKHEKSRCKKYTIGEQHICVIPKRKK